MTDKEYFDMIHSISDAREMLRHILDAVDGGYFGHDPYYAEIKMVLMGQAKQILSEGEKLGDEAAAQMYLRSCKGLAKYASVDKVVETFRIDPKNAKAILRWNGSMACKFLRLAGVWDGLDQAEKNVILGYEVQQQEGQ